MYREEPKTWMVIAAIEGYRINDIAK